RTKPKPPTRMGLWRQRPDNRAESRLRDFFWNFTVENKSQSSLNQIEVHSRSVEQYSVSGCSRVTGRCRSRVLLRDRRKAAPLSQPSNSKRVIKLVSIKRGKRSGLLPTEASPGSQVVAETTCSACSQGKNSGSYTPLG